MKQMMMIGSLVAWLCPASRALAATAPGVAQYNQDGSVLAAANGTGISLFSSSGTLVKSIPLGVTSGITQITLSPDGSKAAYIIDATQLWIVDLNSTNKAQAWSPTSSMQTVGDVAWSPMSDHVTFAVSDFTRRNNRSTILTKQVSAYVVNSDGSGRTLLLSYAPAP